MFILIIINRLFISNSEAYYFNNISTNWNFSPIDTFSVGKCNENRINNIHREEWEGLRNGRNCYTFIKMGSCPRRAACRNIPEVSTISLVYWHGNSICSSRSNFKNYMFLLIEASAAQCPLGTRSCGVIGSQKNHLCLESNISCPVNDMIFKSASLPTGADSKSGLIFKNISSTLTTNQLGINEYGFKLPGADLLYSTNQASNENSDNLGIPIQFKISNAQPCQNPYYNNIDFYIYILDKQAGKQYCYQYIDKQSSQDDGEADINDNTLIPHHKRKRNFGAIFSQRIYIE
jgi:hypothetical protein